MRWWTWQTAPLVASEGIIRKTRRRKTEIRVAVPTHTAQGALYLASRVSNPTPGLFLYPDSSRTFTFAHCRKASRIIRCVPSISFKYTKGWRQPRLRQGVRRSRNFCTESTELGDNAASTKRQYRVMLGQLRMNDGNNLNILGNEYSNKISRHTNRNK